jgi:hypothetical protein
MPLQALAAPVLLQPLPAGWGGMLAAQQDLLGPFHGGLASPANIRKKNGKGRGRGKHHLAVAAAEDDPSQRGAPPASGTDAWLASLLGTSHAGCFFRPCQAHKELKRNEVRQRGPA